MKNILNNKIFNSVLIVFSIGLVFGIVFTFIIKEKENDILYKGIEEYIGLISNNTKISTSFINSFINNFIVTNLIFITSFAFIFSPFIYFINFYKGFSIGFLITVLITNYKLYGFKYALLILFPHEYILIPFIILLSSYMLKNVLKLINLYKENKCIRIKTLYNRFFIIYLTCTLIISIISLTEVFINNKIINLLF